MGEARLGSVGDTFTMSAIRGLELIHEDRVAALLAPG